MRPAALLPLKEPALRSYRRGAAGRAWRRYSESQRASLPPLPHRTPDRPGTPGLGSPPGPSAPPAGEEPRLSRFAPRRPSSAERGRRRGRRRFKLAERRQGTGRPFPPTRNAPTHPPSPRRRLGERPPAESPAAAEPSLPAPRRREAAGAWRAPAEPGPSPLWAGGKSLGAAVICGRSGGRQRRGRWRRAARPRGGPWQPAPGRGRPGSAPARSYGPRSQPGERRRLLGQSRSGRAAIAQAGAGSEAAAVAASRRGRQPVSCSGSGRTLPP